MVGSVLLHRAHLACDEIGQRISRGGRSRGSEIKDAEVVQVADDHVLFQRQLAAEIEGVFTLDHADHVTDRIEVGVAYGSGQSTAGAEVAGYGQVGQGLRSLRGKGRSQVVDADAR